MKEVTFHFEGAALCTRPGNSVAAALTEAGIRGFRETESGAGRGIFCGMGVCQDCLVTIDGRPNRRACMTPLREGMKVDRQTARPALTAPPAHTARPERLGPEILVIGGGAAGLWAAIEARRHGAEVVLLDERKVPGGQYYKQRARDADRPLDGQQAEGADLVRAARESGARLIGGAEVWGAFDGPEIMAADADCVYSIRPRSVIVATGAYERPPMVPGWTLPGVMTVGAAQTLWRSYGTLPGRRVAIFGNGPLAAQVALELADGGAEIALLAEAAPPVHRRPAALARMTRADPALAVKGAVMLGRLRRHGIRTRYSAVPLRIEEQGGALVVTYRDRGGTARVTADAVCVTYGFHPQNEILRLLGARMRFDDRFDQLRPDRTDETMTTVPGVYAVGDCCGLGGARAAAVEGRIAGRAAAGAGGPGGAERRSLSRHRSFQDALWQLYAAEPPRLEDAPADTIVCRCEEVTKGMLDAALDTGAEDIGAVKRATRIGMGRCQGRYCAHAVAACMSERSGRARQDMSFFAPRVPVKPVDIGTLVAAEPLLKHLPGDD